MKVGKVPLQQQVLSKLHEPLHWGFFALMAVGSCCDGSFSLTLLFTQTLLTR